MDLEGEHSTKWDVDTNKVSQSGVLLRNVCSSEWHVPQTGLYLTVFL